MPEALPGGSAIRAQDGHTNRGGEFEQRAAFVKAYDLPAGATVGLAYDQSGVYVFGSAAAPAMPKGVTYQRLQHPDGITPIFRILSFDLFATKIYVVAEFADGTLYHFYDGTRISDWQDGRARVSFTVTGGGIQPATSATGSFTVSGGSASILNTFGDVTLGGVSILGAPVQHTGDNSTTAAAIAAQINAFTSAPDYTAVAVGPVVNISAAATGVAANGLLPVLTLNGDVAVTAITALAGGTVSAPSQLADLTVNGVSILAAPVDWTTDNATTAAAIAASINAYASKPDYTATVIGNKINLLAVDPGTAPNGFVVAPTLLRNFVITPNAGIALANGLAPGVVFQSGTFAKTIGSKMYVASQQFLNFSGVLIPTGFQSSNTGAGFIDMSTQAAGAEAVQAVAKYQQFIAVFSGRVTQIWYVDPDPLNNKQTQVLNNMGTLSPRSVTQFGDNDLFFLDESGVRSVRARDASNAASTTDIGIAVDTLIVDKLSNMTTLQRSKVVGFIEPSAGRFWLVFPDEIFVFSFFEGSKISAWSTYTPSVDNVAFTIDEAMVFKKKVYLRSGDKIYVYGGLDAVLAYDSTSPELWTPYLDADAPAVTKQFNSIDVACEGQWIVTAGLDPTNLDASDEVATVDKTTYGGDKIPFEAESTHVSLRFKGVGAGAKKVAAAAINYERAE
ncbi:MAG: hypothetical protein ACXWLZ_00020 [Rhizomicrobium sp.]